jgi:large subunit ribosomal protein L32
MAVPKQKKSRAKKRSRRAQHDKITLPGMTLCPNCGADTIPHRVCGECGTYKGHEVLVIEEEVVEEETEEVAG